ncbi:MAG TPA: hypothetical protein VH063_15290 [Gaiellaceae bacterium]|jgi:cobalamin biosynthesis Mg chelatase CobN|nr:hypothetical protein [Gaiellaceae bacterium]
MIRPALTAWAVAAALALALPAFGTAAGSAPATTTTAADTETTTTAPETTETTESTPTETTTETTTTTPETTTETTTTETTPTNTIGTGGAVIVGAKAAESSSSSDEWGWIAFGILAACVVVFGIVWFVRRHRHRAAPGT